MPLLHELITPTELREELEANKKLGQAAAMVSAEKLQDYALAITDLMPLPDFMCTVGVLEALRRILERKNKPSN